MSTSTSKTPAITPRWTMRGHGDWVIGVVYLPGGRRIITCSQDGSFRPWDLESGTQIGEAWRDNPEMRSMALSPNGKTIASGSENGTVRLWNVETKKVIAKWTGHTNVVCTLCWSADGKRVASGSWNGTARVWDADSGETILTIITGHKWVCVVMYSPDQTKVATGGWKEDAVKIWDARSGKLLATLKHRAAVFSLAWTSDGKKLISGSVGLIRVFDTATWQQIAILDGHTYRVNAFSLSLNDRLLASASWDNTVRLWNLDSNLPVGQPLRHKDQVNCAVLSSDGRVLVTGCESENAYTWDIHALLKEAGLEDLPSTDTNIAPKDRLEQKAPLGDSEIERTPRSSLSDKSFLEADATRCHNEFGDHIDELPLRFFDSMEAEVHSSATGAHSSTSALLARLSSRLHRFRHDHAKLAECPQPSTPSGLHPQVLFARLSSLLHRSPPENDAANELQQPSTPLQVDPHALLAGLSSLLPRSRLNTEEETEPHPTTHSGSRPDALIGRLSSLFRSQPHTNEEMELPQRPWRPHVVEVAPMRDREVLFVAQRSPPDRPHTPPNGTVTPYPLPLRLLAHLVLFLCCAYPQHADGNAQPTQQQPQDKSQTQALQPQPAAPSTSTTPTALDTRTTAPGAASP